MKRAEGPRASARACPRVALARARERGRDGAGVGEHLSEPPGRRLLAVLALGRPGGAAAEPQGGRGALEGRGRRAAREPHPG